MLNTFSFLNKFFWKNKLNIFFAWVLPFILVLLANITFTCSVNLADITSDGSADVNATFLSPIYVVPGVATLSIICLTCLSLPLVIYSFKKADVIKRITMKINNSWSFYSIIGFFYILLCIVSYAFSFFIGSLVIWSIDHQNGIYIEYMLINTNYGNLFFSIIAFALLGTSVGILMSALLNSVVSIQIIGATLVLFSVFLGGGGIPLQYIAMYSQDATTHQFKPFSIWTITYFSPFRYPTALILESVTQGPAFNAGTLTPDQWNQDIIQDLFSEGNFTTLASYKSMHLGYSSIFDIKHAFITNLVPIPYFNFDLGDGNVWNTWYVDKCSGAIYMPYIHTKIIDTWQLNPIIYGAYWSGDINEIFNTGVPAWFPIKNIPTFAFAQPVDKILDLIIPFAISALFLGGSMALYRKNIINSRG